ncbi:MAG: replicative DNA helicase, partial [Candidatus Pacebacteria bacterium]|nr:replicative DNA helicase [Candidatus Paceibacterota bacterium]
MPKETKNPDFGANRMPPQNIEAEQSVLGSLMIDKNAIIKVGDLITPEDFYKDNHGKIYKAMLYLYEHH